MRFDVTGDSENQPAPYPGLVTADAGEQSGGCRQLDRESCRGWCRASRPVSRAQRRQVDGCLEGLGKEIDPYSFALAHTASSRLDRRLQSSRWRGDPWCRRDWRADTQESAARNSSESLRPAPSQSPTIGDQPDLANAEDHEGGGLRNGVREIVHDEICAARTVTPPR